MAKRTKPEKRKRKRKTKGVLSGLAKTPHSRKRKREFSRVRQVLHWAAGIAVGVVVLGIVVVYAFLSFNPTMKELPGETEVTVEAIETDPAGFPDDVVAAARVTVDGRPVLVPLTVERRGEIEIGARLRLRYAYFPQTGAPRIDEWTPIP